MKQSLFFILLVFVSFSCKKTPFEPLGPTDVRIYNNTDKLFTNILVNTSGGEHTFGTLDSHLYTDYYRFEKSYPKIDISLTIGSTTYSTVTQDYTYQNYLGQVKCTYKVYISDPTNKTLDMEVVYDAPLNGKSYICFMREFITVCPRNCYSTCSFRVFADNGRIVRIMPYSGNLATPEGPCIKGLSYLEREFSEDRIIYPLKRKSDGSFIRIDISDALEIIARQLKYVKDQFGSHAVLFYKGSGISGLSNDISSVFWKQYGGVTTTYGNLCWPAGLEAVRLTLGEVKHNVPWDISNAELIILWGKNPAETNIQEIIHIDKALKKGGKLVVIDPRRTPTADKADLLLRPRPGTDAALALAIAGYLVKHGHTDIDFVSKHVLGYKEFAESLSITPEEAHSITGIPTEAIVKLAAMIASSEKVTMIAGYGLQRHSNGGQTIRALLSVMVITGKIGKPGCGFNLQTCKAIFLTQKKNL
ncbi:MAG TPA: molybdopterin-dependent oxidoreductase [Bacteroidales bacterium]|nr:molybdopterin-dependent oxidoreductase [Bacteroidales bacterium]